jgi:hypothetical protein
MSEIWKDIPGYEGKYQASTLGRVRSLKRGLILKGRELKNKRNRTIPYLRHGLCGKDWLAHRLIAFVFIPNPENKAEVNHKDGNKQNNRVDNLEWATSSENRIHAFKNGYQDKTIRLSKLRVGTKSSNNKLSEDQVRQLRLDYSEIKSQRRLAKKYGITKSTCASILNRTTWKHVT